MGRPLRVTLFVDPRGAASLHLTQIFTGYALLVRSQRVAVDVVARPPHVTERPGHVAWAEADGKRIVYDTRDSSEIGDRELTWADLYFKRGCPPAGDDVPSKVRPLGLNYVVHSRGDWRFRRAAWTLRRLRVANAVEVLTSSAGLTTTGSRLLRLNGGPATSSVEDFEAAPGVGEPRAVLLSQTYDPMETPAGQHRDRIRALNEGRAAMIRALKEALGDRVVAGFGPSPHARAEYPDCVVADGDITRKARYLDLVQRSWIGVTTVGLHGSTGWRLAEYVAAARAIVTEPLHHRVPGGFAAGTHYLTYDDPASCVSRVVQLLDDAELRTSMMTANAAYYRAHVRPDALVARTLELDPAGGS